MDTLKLITDRGEIDLNGDEQISISKAIEDILNLKNRATNWSKDFVVDGTPNNNRFFQHIYDCRIDKIQFNPKVKINCRLVLGGNEMINGSLQLIDVENTNGNITYKINIVGKLKNLLTVIGDQDLSAIDMSDYNHVRTSDSVIKSWKYGIYKNGEFKQNYQGGEGYVYPYMVNPVADSSNIRDNVFLTELFPAPYISDIVKRIVKYAGYTLTSKFFDSEYAKSLIYPYNGDKLQMSEEEVNKRKVTAVVSDTELLHGYVQDYVQRIPYMKRGSDWYYTSFLGLTKEEGTLTENGNDLVLGDGYGQWNGNYFTCNKLGRYDITVNLNGILAVRTIESVDSIEFKQGNFEYRYQLFHQKANGQVIEIDSSKDINNPNDIYGTILHQPSAGEHAENHGSGFITWWDVQSPMLIRMNVSNILLEPNDKIYVRYGFRYPSNVKWKGTHDSKKHCGLLFKKVFDGNFSKIDIKPSSNELIGNDEVDMNQILKGTTMKKFLDDMIDMFDLIIVDNPEKENDLVIEPRVDYFGSRQEILDYDGNYKLDYSQPYILTPMSELDVKTFKYKYADENNDLLNKDYNDSIKESYGSYSLEVLNDFSEQTQVTELSIGATPCGQQYTNGRIAPYIFNVDNEKIVSVKTKRKILFYNGLQDCSAFYLYEYVGGNYTALYQYPYVSMWRGNVGEEYESLEFGRSKKLYHNINKTIPALNLFEKYHKPTINQVIDPNGMLLECYLKLSPADVANFDFRSIIFLLGSYWRMESFEYFPTQADKLTKCKLYKIVDLNIINKYKIEIPTSNRSCPIDMVTRNINGKYNIIESLSGKFVSEDCCKSMGGTYVNGGCRVIKLGGGTGKPILEGTKVIDRVINGGIDFVPVVDIYIDRIKINGGSIGKLGIPTFGTGNFIPDGKSTGIIVGNGNTILKNVTNVLVVGNGITASESGSIYIGDIKIDQSGNIKRNNIYLIDGGKDEVFNYMKTNTIDIIDGGKNAVRNFGGFSKARPIIDGSNK